uniref:Uncharacterized protein n=1 Tax=Panagrolaimus sp. JU765 TaxID=591449 RepID=A0AC34QK59_9BILA
MTAAAFTVGIWLFFITAVLSQEIITEPQEFTVDLGKEVTLPCRVEDFDEDQGIIWKKGEDSVLVLDDLTEEGMQGNYRLLVKNDDHALYISAVEVHHEGNYTCTISDPDKNVKVVHRLHVHVPPTVRISAKTKTLYPRFGETLVLGCHAQGNPVPKIIWKFNNGNAIPVDAKVSKKGVLELPKVDASYAGDYECRATNSFNETASAFVTVKPIPDDFVRDKPSVFIDRAYIPTQQGESLNISCKYTGTPPPDVLWTLNGKSINMNKHLVTSKFENNYTTTTLELRRITGDEFGDYKCQVSNGIGTAFAKIHVNDKPGKPFIQSQDNSSLSWTVESAIPVDQYKVFYRLSGEDKFIDYKIFPSDKRDQEGNIWTRTEKLDFLKPGTEYELQVQGRNKQGWGSYADDYRKVFTPNDFTQQKTNANYATSIFVNIPVLLCGLLMIRL